MPRRSFLRTQLPKADPNEATTVNFTTTNAPQLAVQCDAWVCTLSSNWCILIDELRSTVAEKAGHLYVDIGGGECPKGRRDVGCS